MKNADGLNKSLDALEMLESKWDVILLQEGPAEEIYADLEGNHVWYVAPSFGRKRSLAFLVHSRHADSSLQFCSADGRIAYLDMILNDKAYRFVNAHLPHNGGKYTDADYLASLEIIGKIIEEAERKDSSCIVGLDANAVLGPRNHFDNATLIGPWAVGIRNHRGHLFASWLHVHNLCAVNTRYCKLPERLWTQQQASSGNLRQIDYILVSAKLLSCLRNCDCVDELHFASDHRGLGAELVLSRVQKRKRTGLQKSRWSPILDSLGAPSNFHHTLDASLESVDVGDIHDITQKVVKSALSSCQQAAAKKPKHSAHVLKLFAERRAAADTFERKELTKRLWRALRDERQRKHDQKLDDALNSGKGAKELAKILELPVHKRRILAMKDVNGVRKAARPDIAQVFADFYTQLYSTASAFPEPSVVGEQAFVAITVEEIVRAIKSLKSGRASSDDGLLAEMLKNGTARLHEVLAQAFSLLLEGRSEVPTDWLVNKLVVLFKKGDAELPKNYRPICIIPVLAKLFSVVLLNRIRERLNSLQPFEQAGFRPDFSCSDEVHCLRMLAEKAEECGEILWVASLDMEKAFDKVLKSSVMQCLQGAEVDCHILHVIWRIYEKQRAFVFVDQGTVSQFFNIVCGVRQGDPLSPLLFNNVTRVLFCELKEKWQRKGWGSIVGSDLGQRMTHAMFADDTILVASTRQSLQRMIEDTRLKLAEHGLKLNIDKCMIQTNASTSLKALRVNGELMPLVLPCQGFPVLGTNFTLHGRTSREIQLRISAAWGKFHQLWHLLKRRDTNAQKRLRLFDMCVTQTALWCNESWLLTVAERRRLQSVQNEMLRRIVGPRRRPDEEYVDWIVHATAAARRIAKSAGIRFWAETHLTSKFRWAGHVMRMDDRRLAKRATEWRDSEWWSTELQLPASLRIRRPFKTRWFRWEDDLKRFAVHMGWTCWQDKAQERDHAGKPSVWNSAAQNFTKRILRIP